ncbi:MAG: IclR family transcriptional regulator [Synergistaceae bacterium]|jgi:DNA-binding IclR family transcriptional regulator|nr:IclR family transcriptional regulator [Synergistaceae bacterium]
MDSVKRIVALMETLLGNEGDIGIREIARLTGIPKSTVQRLLSELCENDWVIQDVRTQNYRVALHLLSFANAWRLKLELTRRARDVMDELCGESRQTILLLVQDGTKGICLHKVEPERTIKLVADVGKTFPLHAAACGKILLAFTSPSLQEKIFALPFEQYTKATITEPSLLKKEIEQIRRDGYAISFEEMTPGAAEIAVPLLDAQKNLVAALSIAGPRFDMEEHLKRFEELLKKASNHILKRQYQ